MPPPSSSAHKRAPPGLQFLFPGGLCGAAALLFAKHFPMSSASERPWRIRQEVRGLRTDLRSRGWGGGGGTSYF